MVLEAPVGIKENCLDIYKKHYHSKWFEPLQGNQPVANFKRHARFRRALWHCSLMHSMLCQRHTFGAPSYIGATSFSDADAAVVSKYCHNLFLLNTIPVPKNQDPESNIESMPFAAWRSMFQLIYGG